MGAAHSDNAHSGSHDETKATGLDRRKEAQANTSATKQPATPVCAMNGLAKAPTHHVANMAAVKLSANKLEAEVHAAAQKVWDYHHMGHRMDIEFLRSLDGILVFCSSDVSVADVAAKLWIRAVDIIDKAILGTGSDNEAVDNEGSPGIPYLLFSGGKGTGPHSGANLLGWKEPEAVVLSQRAREVIAKGRPELLSRLQLLVEDQARNSGENTSLSRKLISEAGLAAPKKVAVVQKPFMERRTFATIRKQWPEVSDVRLCSASVEFDKYPDQAGVSMDDVVGIMIGDLQRITLYAPPHGDFQIAQDIPRDVEAAFDFLAYDPRVRNRHPTFAMNLVQINE
eukprot:INCI18109.2.p1 GENE.INCI18109.2~~INCI18109.2.p1  ORF type:complete len:340 (-),score=66.92 INCI18109.2:1176-2195(-)